MREDILRALHEGPKTKKQFLEAGFDKLKVGIQLPKMRKQGLVESYEVNHETGELQWALTDAGKNAFDNLPTTEPGTSAGPESLKELLTLGPPSEED